MEKNEWMSAFQQGLGEGLCTTQLDQDRLAPLWMPDDATKVCLCCGMLHIPRSLNIAEVKFTTFNRRHHCRQCGIVVCGKCSNHDKFLPGKGKKVRVCTRCFLVKPGIDTVGSSEIPSIARSKVRVKMYLN